MEMTFEKLTGCTKDSLTEEFNKGFALEQIRQYNELVDLINKYNFTDDEKSFLNILYSGNFNFSCFLMDPKSTYDAYVSSNELYKLMKRCLSGEDTI